MTTDQKPKQINWSAVLTAAGAVIGAIHLKDWTDWDSWLQDVPVLIGIFVAAYKGTAKGSLSVKRKPQPAQPINDEGM